MVDHRDSLAREVDEELRREQLLKLWEKYGTYAVAVGVAIIVGVGGYKFLEARRIAAGEVAGAQLAQASRELAQNKKGDASKTLDAIVASSSGGYAALARLRLAAADRDAGKVAEAAAAYEAIAKSSGVDPLLADYAQLQAAMLRLDGASWTDMQNRLTGIAGDKNPWRFSARELLGLAAQKAGKSAEARTEFQRLLGDRDTPPSIAERARIMMAMLTEAELAKSAPADDKSKAGAPEQKTK